MKFKYLKFKCLVEEALALLHCCPVAPTFLAFMLLRFTSHAITVVDCWLIACRGFRRSLEEIIQILTK